MFTKLHWVELLPEIQTFAPELQNNTICSTAVEVSWTGKRVLPPAQYGHDRIVNFCLFFIVLADEQCPREVRVIPSNQYAEVQEQKIVSANPLVAGKMMGSGRVRSKCHYRIKSRAIGAQLLCHPFNLLCNLGFGFSWFDKFQQVPENPINYLLPLADVC